MDSEDSREDVRGGGSSSGDSSPERKETGGEPTPRSPSSTPQSPESTPQSPDSDAAFGEARRHPETPPMRLRPQSPEAKRLSETEGGSPVSEKNYYPKSPEPPASPDPPLSRSRSPVSPPRSPPLHDENEASGHKWSPKSESRSRQDSLSPAASRGSEKFDRTSGRESRERAVSESSNSSRESTPERRPATKDPPTEEVSDGEMESDHENDKSGNKSMSEGAPSPKSEKRASESNVNMSHEDLSDVSDLDSMGPPSEEEHRSVKKSPIRAPDQSDSGESPPKPETKLNGNVNAKIAPISPPNTTNGGPSLDIPRMDKIPQEKTSKTEDVEEQLDFEAEEGECIEAPSPAKNNLNNADSANKDDDEGSGAASSLEEGEVSDEEERRPEETEPRPICRFYSKGQCTWGISCRFLHPGVTDKGNYTMFDMVRAMPAGYGHGGGHHHHPHHQHIPVMHPPARLPPAESPWERGLRTAKEMLRKASKRKEQDSDFEEKKMHLSLAGSGGTGGVGVRSGSPLLEEEEGDLALYTAFPPSTSQPASPPPSHSMPLAHIKRERDREREDYYRQLDRRAAYEEATSRANYAPRERASRYRTTSSAIPASPPPPSARHHRQPPAHYMEQDIHERGQPPAAQSAHHKSRRGRTTREVIVQRAARGDEWADPWMRGGGDRAGGAQAVSRDDRPGKKARNYSSATSYSSSSSRSSSSKRSGSPGRNVTRRGLHSPMKQRLAALSPSVIVQERRAATARALAMNPPAPSSRKRAPSPAAARQHAANPPPPQHTKVDAFGRPKPGKPKQQRQRKHYSKSSTSGSDTSSSSSDSESDSRSSSSSSSSSLRRAGAMGGGVPRGQPVHHPHLQANPNERKHRQEVKTAGGQPLVRSGQPMAQKKDSMIDGDMRKDMSLSKKRAPTSPINSMVPAKKPASRREELLKQLKAVEDAIARKRSKI